MTGDVLALQDDRRAGESLLLPLMRHGRRLAAPPALADIRKRAAQGLAKLPEPLRHLSDGTTLPETVAPGLIALAVEVDRRCAGIS